MTEGYNEYYLCGDRTLESLIRDQVLSSTKFKIPPEFLRDRMMVLADIFHVHDPYHVSVITDVNNNPFNYRVEITTAFTKEQLHTIQDDGFAFESIGPRGESIAIWLK